MVSRGTSNPVINQLNRSYREIKITMIYSKFAQYDMSDSELFVTQSYAGEFVDSDMFFTTAYIARMLDIPTNASIGIDIEKNEVVAEFDGQTKTFPLSLLVERLAIDFLNNNVEYRKQFKPNFDICQQKLNLALDNFQSNIMKFDNVTFLDSENITFEQINEECTSIEVRISDIIEKYTSDEIDEEKLTNAKQNINATTDVSQTIIKAKFPNQSADAAIDEQQDSDKNDESDKDMLTLEEPKMEKQTNHENHNVVLIVFLIIGVMFLVGILFLIILRQQGISRNDIFAKNKRYEHDEMSE